MTTQTYRFGRRMPLPSSVQILHELLAFSASEDAKERAAQRPAPPPAESYERPVPPRRDAAAPSLVGSPL
jgi:hypothetical protein